MFWLSVAKEIAVGVAQIVWAIVWDFLIMGLIVYPVCIAVMWTLTKLGFWQMPQFPYDGHFKLPWKSA